MTRIAYVAAPALIVGYGLVRLIDGIDGSHGPGPAWTIGHLMFGFAMLLFPVVLVNLRQALQRQRPLGTAAVVVGVLGLLAFIRVIVIDLLVGFGSADRAAMNAKYPTYAGFPGGLPESVSNLFETVGPPLFGVGLLTLLTLLATLRPRTVAWWSPVLAAVAFAIMSTNLDLLSLGAAALLIALLPLFRRTPTTSPDHREPGITAHPSAR